MTTTTLPETLNRLAMMYLKRKRRKCAAAVEVFTLGLCLLIVAGKSKSKDGVCSGIEIRNEVTNFYKIENCTVIEGSLHILLMDYATSDQYKDLHFPKLLEITENLLMYRVYGLKTLRNIFPNLCVIRGQKLFYNYALVAFEMPDLEELGLTSLTVIERGAVRLEKNPNLCYIATINWASIIKSATRMDNLFIFNKDKLECVDVCPDNCKNCWSSQDCQKNLDCHCLDGDGFCQDDKTCCHKNCIGGCNGTGPSDCFVCRDVYHDGLCKKQCPRKTYKYKDWRCILKEECQMLKGSWKLLEANMTSNGLALCVKDCPVGYTEDKNHKNRCTKCLTRCPKECSSAVINSITAAQKVHGCTIINGVLKLEGMIGNSVVKELEENLGQIEEVWGSIKILQLDGLTSLYFFKSLKLIRGDHLENERYSLFLLDNENLQHLFPPDVTRSLKIMKGKVFFHENRRLCYYKILEFLNATKLNKKYNHTDLDISPHNNGDLIPCTTKVLPFFITGVAATYAILRWKIFEVVDRRELLGYMVNYREVTSRNITVFQGKDTCSDNMWKTSHVNPDSSDPESNTSYQFTLLSPLKPWTEYAVYVQTYTVSTAKESGMSKIRFFKTKPGVPTSPTNLKVKAEQAGELVVSWSPPHEPNGEISHYLVYWQAEPFHTEEYEKRDYCANPSVSLNENEKEKKKQNETQKGQCCACPKVEKELELEENERLMQIEFENFLQNNVYIKRDLPKPERIEKSRRKRTLDDFLDSTHEKNKYVPTQNTSSASNETSTSTPTEPTFLGTSVYSRTYVVLTNLHHFQEYNIEVLACLEMEPKMKQKVCSNRAIATARTLPDENADTVRDSSVSAVSLKNGSGDVLVTWDVPPNPNGLIVTYDVGYKKVNTDSDNTGQTILCVTQKQYKLLSGSRLQLDTGNYSINIRATSLAKIGKWTESIYFVVHQKDVKQHWPLPTILLISLPCVAVLLIMILGFTICILKNRYRRQQGGVLYASVNPEYMSVGEVYIPDEWEVDRDKIELLRELGQGSFGMVYEGIARNIIEGTPEIHVAIKTVSENATTSERLNFLKEASVMKAFYCHHIVRLLGVVSQGKPLVIMELMANEDLKTFLRRHRPDDEENNGKPPPTLKEILQMAAEITDGMAYLADKKYVHRDLAARNCMVAEDMTVKIGDFGMTRDIYETDYYRKGGKGLLPVRWMAPESLKDGVFSSMSDMWSFGVVLWEMATLAAQPYQGLSNEEVLKFVADGKIMERPEGCPDQLYDLMLQCWRYPPKQRPLFKDIVHKLELDLPPSFRETSYVFSENKRHHSMDLDSLFQERTDVNEPFISSNNEQQVSDEYPDLPSLEGSEAEEIPSVPEVESLHIDGNHHHSRSRAVESPDSDYTYKSNEHPYLHKNGIANGHIHLQMPRTTAC